MICTQFLCIAYIPQEHIQQEVCQLQLIPDTKPNPNPHPNPTTKQHAIAKIQLNIVTCPTYSDKKSYETMLLHCL